MKLKSRDPKHTGETMALFLLIGLFFVTTANASQTSELEFVSQTGIIVRNGGNVYLTHNKFSVHFQIPFLEAPPSPQLMDVCDTSQVQKMYLGLIQSMCSAYKPLYKDIHRLQQIITHQINGYHDLELSVVKALNLTNFDIQDFVLTGKLQGLDIPQDFFNRSTSKEVKGTLLCLLRSRRVCVVKSRQFLSALQLPENDLDTLIAHILFVKAYIISMYDQKMSPNRFDRIYVDNWQMLVELIVVRWNGNIGNIEQLQQILDSFPVFEQLKTDRSRVMDVYKVITIPQVPETEQYQEGSDNTEETISPYNTQSTQSQERQDYIQTRRARHVIDNHPVENKGYPYPTIQRYKSTEKRAQRHKRSKLSRGWARFWGTTSWDDFHQQNVGLNNRINILHHGIEETQKEFYGLALSVNSTQAALRQVADQQMKEGEYINMIKHKLSEVITTVNAQRDIMLQREELGASILNGMIIQTLKLMTYRAYSEAYARDILSLMQGTLTYELAPPHVLKAWLIEVSKYLEENYPEYIICPLALESVSEYFYNTKTVQNIVKANGYVNITVLIPLMENPGTPYSLHEIQSLEMPAGYNCYIF